MFNSKGNPRISKKCEQCGERFRTRNQDKKYCNKTCRKVADNFRNRQEQLDTGFLISDKDLTGN